MYDLVMSLMAVAALYVLFMMAGVVLRTVRGWHKPAGQDVRQWR